MVQDSDLTPCQPLIADEGAMASHALKADAVNAGRHIECQARNLGLLGIVWELVGRGLLRVEKRP